jgi:protein-disulfide isomerase
MKFLAIIFVLLTVGFTLFAQKLERVLATATGISITAQDLPAELQSGYSNSDKLLSEKRVSLLQEQIASELLNIEAKAKKLTVEKLLETVVFANIIDPKEEDVRAIFQANQAQIGKKTLDEIRPDIVRFLRQEPERKAFEEFVSKSKMRNTVIFGKSISEKSLKASDILVTIGAKRITFKDFNDRNGPKLADFEGNQYDLLKSAVDDAVFAKILPIEAKSSGLEQSELIAREITDKLRDYSDEERELLERGFRQSLFTKYRMKTFLAEPVPFVQKISIDDDPMQGNPNANVTVVMFSDFQCPACGSFHPILKRVIAGFGSNVRFVVRDFPLVSIHENAFRAAVAANAANAQGKYFDYADLLFKNQANLDGMSLKKYAADLGLNLERFGLDLVNEKIADEVRNDLTDGNSYGISGTPTIYVNGVKVRTLSAEALKNAIEKALKK